MITGVKPEDVGGHNQYNITPEGLMGDKDIGFKTYGHFTLDEGDIANLIFTARNMEIYAAITCFGGLEGIPVFFWPVLPGMSLATWGCQRVRMATFW